MVLSALPAGAQPLHQAPKASCGVLDLRQVPVEQQTVKLDGEWIFYPGQIIAPDADFSKHKGYYVPYPKLWHNIIINGKPLSPIGYGTYRLTVLIDSAVNSENLALDIPDVYSSLTVFVDNTPFFNLGVPGTSAQSTKPYFRPSAKRLHCETGGFTLTLHVANFHHSKGGPNKSILLGNNDILKHNRENARSYDVFLAGCLFMGGLFFLGLFAFGRKDKATLYFSLFCLAYTYRIVGTDEYTLHHVFPNLSWFVTLRLEYLSLYASFIFLILFNYTLYPVEFNRQLMRLFVGISMGLFTVTLFAPSVFYTRLLTPFLIMVVIKLVYTVYVYVLGYINKRSGALFSLISTSILSILGLLIISSYYLDVRPNRSILLLAYVAFFFFQSLVLSHRFASVLNAAKDKAMMAYKAKSDFLSTMSHEIRTPLNSVIGITNLLLQKKPDKEQKEYLDTLLFSANNLLYIINDILDFTKLEAGKMKLKYRPARLGEIGRRIVNTTGILANEKGIAMHFVCDEVLHQQSVMIDADRTTQVINNLMMNAIKFTAEGSVSLIMQLKEQNETHLTAEIRVEDTGIGIPAEKQQLIFEKFTQVDSSINRGYGGTGLGLPICKEILSLQGVDLLLQSEEGKGSKFWFVQVFEKAAEASPTDGQQVQETELEVAAYLNGRTILIAEDNAINMMVVEKILLNLAPGIIIKKALNGEEAVKAYLEVNPDLILMDVNMPVMDGLRASITIREQEALKGGEKIPIIALTAGTMREDKERCLEAGMDAMIGKPFKIEELRDTMIRLLETYQNDRES
jgi:signal transduction histidine kinase/CheY-like chemotaxis protein